MSGSEDDVLIVQCPQHVANRLSCINDSLNVVCVAADRIGVTMSDLLQSIEFSVISLQDYARKIVMKGPPRQAWRNLQRGRWAR